MAEFSDKDRKVLWARARNRCSFPQCQEALTQDQIDASSGEGFQTVIGEEAHIYSAKSNGPRYDPKYPVTKLETYENRILLCRNHHRLIDSETGRAYDPMTLVKMKQRHEKQEKHRERISVAVRAYVADRYVADDRVLFRQVKLEGPKVDAMFVDVPFAAREDAAAGVLLGQIAADRPGDADAEPGYVVTGAAQALLHPEWSGNALVIGAPGQGKSTLLQYVCQFHRARLLGRRDYDGEAQGLEPVSTIARVPIRVDLRDYAQWAASNAPPSQKAKGAGRRESARSNKWRSIEEFVASHIAKNSGGHKFNVKDVSSLVSAQAVLLALDGLDEVANLEHRDQVANEIVRTSSRLKADAHDLMVVVASRPGLTNSFLWSSSDFPTFYLQRLTAGLRLQYLQRWCKVAEIDGDAANKLQRTFLEHEDLPHIRDLASYPMQLAILLHLLQRRGLLPQERTELYSEYVKAFLDREETEDKEPLLSSERDVIEDIHALLGWYLQKEAEGGKASGQISRRDLERLLAQHLTGRSKGAELAAQLFAALTSRVLCLIEREPGLFQFEVQSLREYFAAAYINEYADPRSVGNSRVDCLDALLERPYWLNTCRFFVGMFTKIEVRGLRQSLRELRAKPDLALHPHLRLAAGRLLDDRAYQGQPDDTLREIVEFVLDGPGVVLADDGLLDESDQPLSFAEDAGRAQVVNILKARLGGENDPGIRLAISRMLYRHFEDKSELVRWWWEQFEANGKWLEVAADLGAMEAQAGRVSDLADAVKAASSAETHWVSETLVRGGYSGSVDDVLQVCIGEINDGAADVLGVSSGTAIGKITEAARTAQLRPLTGGVKAANTRTRFRRGNGRALVADLLTGSEQIRARPAPAATASVWSARLSKVSKVWGDGWVLRQAVAMVPANIETAEAAKLVVSQDQLLTKVLTRESELRAGRGDVEWWRNDLQAASAGLERRSWLFSVLTGAHTQVLIDLAAEINEMATGLSPKHYRGMEGALRAFRQCSLFREISLREPLRRGQAIYRPRALWLIRTLATESSVEQIDKKLTANFSELLVPGMGDRRSLLRVLGATKTVKVGALKGTRDVLPAGAWAEKIKLGAINAATAADVLRHPEEWPLEIVGRAVQHADARLNSLETIAKLSEKAKWFESESEA